MAEDKLQQEAKERLLVAATKLFAEKGYAGVSIRQLAEAAEVNSAMISYYYGDKEGLYEAVLSALYVNLLSQFEVVAAQKTSAQEKLRMYAEVIRRTHTQDQPLMARLVLGELSSPTACLELIIRKYTARIVQIISSIIREGIDNGELRQDIDARFAAGAFGGMINFFFIMREATRLVMPVLDGSDKEFVDSAMKIYLQGMGRNEG